MVNMKRFLAFIMIMCTMAVSTAVFAADKTVTGLTVDGKAIDISAQIMPYYEGDMVMVPLRTVSEALGYSVGWDGEKGEAYVEDAYTQKAVIKNGETKIDFYGKLTIIDLTREVEEPAAAAIKNGVTFVPVNFFGEFFNDTAVKDGNISIEPQRAYIDNISAGANAEK